MFYDQQELGTFLVQSSGRSGGRGGGRRGGGGGGGGAPAEFSAARNGQAMPNPTAYMAGIGGAWAPASFSTQQQQQQQFSPSRGGGGMSDASSGVDDVYEVHDNQLKAPVSVRRQDVEPTAGSHRLFSAPAQQLNSANATPQRNAPRICEPFQQGQCVSGDECPDVHVSMDVLQSIRSQMVTWLNAKEKEFQETALDAPGTSFRVFAADLKEVVDVPIAALSFTRGLYVDPSARAKRSRYGQQSAFALMAAQVPTACGLHSVDPLQCKWGRWCNQAHIDPNWMRHKRGEFENWSKSLEQRFEEMPEEHVFVVHDPQLKSSLQVPKMSIAGFSRGLFQGNQKKAPSVCMLYQRNRCTAGSCCNQIHIFPEYLVLLRQYTSDPSPELFFTMQQVAMQQKQLFLMQQQQQSIAMQHALNPSARPFIPPNSGMGHPSVGGMMGGFPGMAFFAPMMPMMGMMPMMVPQQGHGGMSAFSSGQATPQAQRNLADSAAVDDRSQQLQQQHTHKESEPLVQLAPMHEYAAVTTGEDGNTASLSSSPNLGPRSPSGSTSAVRQVLSHSPYKRSGLLADLRGDNDEVFDRRRTSGNPHVPNLQNSFTSNSASSPVKRNNPYQVAQKPIGVPPSPLHAAALPPPSPSSAMQLPQATVSNSSMPHTPPMHFGWVPPARMPPSMAIPPSPFRGGAYSSSNLPTSPQQAPHNNFTPDLTHVQFSASPLMHPADSMTHMPALRNLTLDSFEEFHLQQSGSFAQHPSNGSGFQNSVSGLHQGGNGSFSQAPGGGPLLTGHASTTTNVRQSQPYQHNHQQQPPSGS